ncbi:hypothetical protein FEM48_Zijuj08G0118200 [Ziziphus jujuba var. spinosa]|uniref:Uncharacterized protein n=1 Tax=Ziziphus jujuba var. spinosa TaxID=714518 RepID=A0A978UYX6_ZIZJJ|nr:hypothetical protein FEM48_Zijuj08G0118200 [Ziziphus jujuba var. spinosa]
MKKGIFVGASAGNHGSIIGTLANGAPWVVTVGAGTVDRELAGTITLGNGVQISFETLYPGNYSSDQVPIVFVDGCLDVNELKRHKNKIVVCKDNLNRNDQVKNVNSANVYEGIFISNITLSDSSTRDTGFLSAFIGPRDGQEVIDYIKNSTKIIPKAKLEFQKTILGTKPAPKVDSYSSRGPFPSCPNVLKPDILTPGTSILASWSPTSWVAKVRSESLFSNFNLDTGTSMATPHVAGVAALIKAVHPNWSPAAVRSAIMTTANPLDNTQTPIKDVAENDDKPANSLGIGSGHIEPNKALNPGLIYEAETEDYINFLCAFNYTAKQIRIITGSAQSCANSSLHLNYPSFIAYFIGDKKSTKAKIVQEFRRTVTNVGEESSSYTANLTSMVGLNAKVELQRLVFRKKFEKLSYKLSLEVFWSTFGLRFERGLLATIERVWIPDWSSSIYPAYQTMPFHGVGREGRFRGDNLVEMGFAGGRVRVSFDSGWRAGSNGFKRLRGQEWLQIEKKWRTGVRGRLKAWKEGRTKVTQVFWWVSFVPLVSDNSTNGTHLSRPSFSFPNTRLGLKPIRSWPVLCNKHHL